MRSNISSRHGTGQTHERLAGAGDEAFEVTARFRLGMFDPPERVPFARIPYSENQSAAHDALSRRTAQASMVLLKNNGLLPLSKKAVKTVAVIGPNSPRRS